MSQHLEIRPRAKGLTTLALVSTLAACGAFDPSLLDVANPPTKVPNPPGAQDAGKDGRTPVPDANVPDTGPAMDAGDGSVSPTPPFDSGPSCDGGSCDAGCDGACDAGCGTGTCAGPDRQKRITLDGAQVLATLTNFPVLIRLTDTDLRARAATDGSDIAFFAADQSTLLDYQIEDYDSVTGSLSAWVRIASLPSPTDTELYLRYGGGQADRSNPGGVWDSEFEGVWHLSNDDLGDSTTHGRNGTNNGSLDAPGQISGARTFSGNDYVLIGTGVLPDEEFYTISTWAKIDIDVGEPRKYLVSNSRSLPGYEGIDLGIQSPSGELGHFINAAWRFSSLLLPDQVWAYVVMRSRAHASSGYVEYSINGGAFAYAYPVGDTTSERNVSSSPLCIGGWAGTGYSAEGEIDEVHISSSLRSDAWTTTEYNNQRPASTFIKSLGPETAVPN